MPKVDLTGKVFGRLTVLSPADKPVTVVRNDQYWLCRCSCGSMRVVREYSLLRGTTKSCGCIGIERISKLNVSHKQSKSLEYRRWRDMLNRCYWEKQVFYHRYGGRGISVCRRWRHSFENFLADMGPMPFSKATLDRIDNDGNYNKKNCRWVSQTENARNKSDTLFLTYRGQKKALAAWAEQIGIPQRILRKRLVLGWDAERIIDTPVRNVRHTLTFKGQTLSYMGWAKKLGWNYSVIARRVQYGWPVERILTQKRQGDK